MLLQDPTNECNLVTGNKALLARQIYMSTFEDRETHPSL